MIETKMKSMVEKKITSNPMFETIQKKIYQLEQLLKENCVAENVEMRNDLERVVTSGGKRLRPTLAFLSYLVSGKNEKPILPLMCMLELMHTTSLIHDDVIDEATTRRSVATINQTSGKKKAVQSGDFLLSRAMKLLHIYQGTGINEVLSEISTQMCLGEFLQMKNLYDLKNQTMDTYFLQAKRKTGYLIATSCYTGALAGGMEKDQAEYLRNYGQNIGIAFQLRDDLLDFESSTQIEKSSNQDLKRGIFTYPVLYLKEKGISKELVSLFEKKNKTDHEIDVLIDYIKSSDAIKKTKTQIEYFSEMAIAELRKFSKTEASNALEILAKELNVRKK